MKVARLLTVWMALSVATGGFSSRAAAQGTLTPQLLDERLRLLEREVKRLHSVEEELNRLKSQIETQKSVTTGSDATVAQKTEALEREVKILKRQREVDQETQAAAAQKAKTLPTLTAGSEGFALKSADGNFLLKLRGLIHTDGRFFLDNENNSKIDTFLPRRVRPILEGTVFKKFDFRLTPDFGGGKTVVRDAYLDARFLPELALKVGKFKSPVGLERLQSASDLVFVERAYPTSVAPDRDIGVDLHGEFLGGVIGYDLGVFNGVPDGATSETSGDTDQNGSKDIEARLFFRPFLKTDLVPLQGLGLGIAGTIGTENSAAPTYKSIGQQTFFSVTNTTTITSDGNRDRISPQGYYYWGPFGLIGEYIVSSENLRKGTLTKRVQNSAWQVAASYVLTGEKASYKGVVPDRPFDPFKSQWGALEIKARVTELDVDNEAFRNYGTAGSPNRFADPSKSASTATTWGVGVNWYLNKNAKFVWDYHQTHFDGGAVGGNRPVEKAVFGRFQVAF